jgi:ABC-type protease/lipase transport system fused ATPase/permease subunit
MLEHARRMMLGHISQWLDDQLSVPVIQRAMEARLAGSGLEVGLKDVADLRGFIAGDGMLTFLDAPWTPVFLVFMWLLHPILGVVGLAGAALLFCGALANDFFTRRKNQEAAAGLRRSQYVVGQFIDGAETLRSLGMSQPALQRWEENQRSLMQLQSRLLQRTNIIGSVSRSVRLALQVAVLGLGAWRSLISAHTAHRNLMKLFADTRSMQNTGVTLPRPLGRLKLENLHYYAPGASQAVLNAISFGIEPGQTCGVIGSAGSGKTTLCRLIVGTLRPSLGHARLDGAEVWNWPSDELGHHIGYLPQQVDLFPGTIAENIARLRDVDSEAVIAAAQLAGIHEMILRLPNGYRTEVGPHGVRISRGQRQRIALARALFGDPPLVVLDEPNTGLDGEGEVALFNVLQQLKERGRTVVVVSHRTNLLRTADHIVFLREGSLLMFGARDEVLGALAGRPKPISVPAAMQDKIAANGPAKLKAAE